jgi:hypothetical protein
VKIWVEQAGNHSLRKITRNHSIPRGIAALQAKSGSAPFMGSVASCGKGFENRKLFKLCTDLNSKNYQGVFKLHIRFVNGSHSYA